MKEIFTSETFQMLSDRIDTFMEEHDVYDYDNVTIIIEKVADEADPSGYTWKATLMPKDTRNTMKDLLVEEHGLVRFFFTEDDISDCVASLHGDGTIPVDELTREQMEHVKYVLSNCDAEYGINWDAIEGAVTDLFDDGIDLDSPAWDTIEDGMTPEQ